MPVWVILGYKYLSVLLEMKPSAINTNIVLKLTNLSQDGLYIIELFDKQSI